MKAIIKKGDDFLSIEETVGSMVVGMGLVTTENSNDSDPSDRATCDFTIEMKRKYNHKGEGTVNYTELVDTVIEGIAEAYVNAKIWVERNKRSAVHIVKTHYKDLQDGIEKDCWNLKWDNDKDRIDYMDYNIVENSKECFEVYNRLTNKRYTVYAKLRNSKLPLGHYEIESNFALKEDALEFMRLLNVENKYGTLFCMTYERQKDGSYKEVK